MGEKMGDRIMKREPKSLPPRYKKQFDPKKGEWKVKKKFKYVNEDGETKDTETKWKFTIEECETEARKVQENHGWGEAKRIKTLCVRSTLEAYVEVLNKDAHKVNSDKNSNAIDKWESTSALLKKYTPDSVGDILIKNINASVFTRWVDWINSDTVGHQALSGNRVRKLKTMISHYMEDYLYPNGFIESGDVALYKTAISNVKVKPKRAGKRTNRNEIDFDDLKKISEYYKQKGLGTFNNFYWYVFFQVLFCTGMRVGEMVALQWKDIQFSDKPEENIIYVNNSIGEKEKRENVERILKANNRRPKNQGSIREITMWSYYRELLKDYRHSYMLHYDYSSVKEMDECFVFTNLRSRTDSKGYQTQKNALREINNTMEKLGLPKTDNQMFRHACAKFLIYHYNFSVEETHDYFGHQDSKMINEVYAKLEPGEKRKKISNTQKMLITSKELVYKDEKDERARVVIAGDKQDAMIKGSRIVREVAQIERAIAKGKEFYYYPEDYEDIISEIIATHPEFGEKIKFRLEEE